ncbi:MAG: arginine--tRNA ligase [Betaproteobacteria bacterium]|nr:arginine--tRNA ligase [Betaproteobacteria bacterium]
MPSPKDTVELILAGAVRRVAPGIDITLRLELPRNPDHGDYATSVALQLAKPLARKPREIAEEIVHNAKADIEKNGASLEIAGAGFINIRLRSTTKQAVVAEILKQGSNYGRVSAARPEKVMVEFVSANPTGPLHVGHGRQAALGDALAALLESQGHEVTREFYYNDAGAQIQNLALSVQARAQGVEPGGPGWPADAYAGDYIREIAEDFKARGGNPRGDLDDLDAVRRFAVAFLRDEQDMDLQKFGVKFGVYFLESSLYAGGKVEGTVEGLIASGKTYEKDGALWLRTTDYGDDKDRVVRKSDGSYTYFVPDVAYHVNKWQRGFAKVINVQGTDHHSAVTRVRAGLQALGIGISEGYPDYVLHSLVKVMRGGAEVKISKRAGSYVTVRDLIEWVGRDAVRFFLVSRKADSEFTFDIDLALAKSEENPVYYVQYAHARICSMLAQWGGDPARLAQVALGALTGEKELRLAQRLAEFPDMLAAAAGELAPHAVAFYLRALAGDFHSYYNAERILVEDEALRDARLALCAAIRQTIANGLALLGVSAPEKM